MDAHTWQDIVNYGAPMVILAFIGIAMWRLSVKLTRWALGDDSRNPPTRGVLTDKIESSTRRDERMVEFINAMDSHVEQQKELCRTHAQSLGHIADVIQHDVVGADQRSKALEDLIQLHTNHEIPGSTAAAIEDVKRIREASWRTCVMCRNLISDTDIPQKEQIIAQCDAIESILKHKENDG